MSEDSPCWVADGAWTGYPLDTARLRLRRIVPDDTAWVAEAANDWEVAKFTRLPHPLTRAAADEHFAERITAMREGRAVPMILEDRRDGAPLGAIDLMVDRQANTAQLGYWLRRDRWRDGLMTEAVRRMVRLAFRTLKLDRVVADVMAENTGSEKVLEKLGFAASCGTVGCAARGEVLPARRWTLDRQTWEAAWSARPMVLVAAVALVDLDGRVLLAQRPPGKSMAGLWEFPGGKVHAGETPEAALVREMEEELGIDARESCLAPLTFASHDYDTFHLLMPLYVCRTWKGMVRPCEGQQLAWARPARLGDYAMPPADVPLVALLRDWL
jgi:8-oxo-dGTP diphosphatase